MAGNFLSWGLSMLHGMDKMIWWGVVIQIVGVAGGTALAAFAPAGGPAIIFVPPPVTGFGNGVMLPNAIAGAISARPQAAGGAAGFLGCIQMMGGGAFARLGRLVLAAVATGLPPALPPGA